MPAIPKTRVGCQTGNAGYFKGGRIAIICNLYRLTTPTSAIASLFGATTGSAPNVADEIYPGYAGLVVADGIVQAMTWGFPRKMKSKRTGLPIKPRTVNNARDDRLATPFWRESFINRRCLIPVSAWAEAQGEAGHMTRTWYGVPGDIPFAVAGIWRPTEECGNAYSMVMVNSCMLMADVHDRMPTILRPEDWNVWLHSDPDDAFALCRIWSGQLTVDMTLEPWAKPRQSKPSTPTLL
ncbi:SOS response-associated peptidase [Novosphingobium sp. HR1a]|uniref:SOS response-associated peptidase n=1 Tax=Novosphingobium TaxID=165696 RepID=UPI0035C74ED5